MAPETRYARSGELHVAYQVVGEGSMDLVFVPSWISQVEHYWEEPTVARYFNRLASFSRLIMFDRRGSGLSDPVLRAPTLEEQMDDVVAVMDTAGSERATVFAQLEGGAMAALFAATHPERTEALVLYEAMPRMSWAPDYDWPPRPEEREAMLRDGGLATWGDGSRLLGLAPQSAENYRLRRWFAKLERLAEHIPGARYVELPGSKAFSFGPETRQLLDEVEEFLTGARHVAESERILATVMFSDIVDSTRRAAELGDRDWRQLLEALEGLVGTELDRFRGRAIKTMGDGFLATFDGPARAIRCAVAIRAAAAEFGLEVRCGLHTGEVEVMGADVGGIAVHIGAWVGALAGPGEVLVSGTVRDLVVGSGISFEDRGERELKGVPGLWRLWAAAT